MCYLVFWYVFISPDSPRPIYWKLLRRNCIVIYYYVSYIHIQFFRWGTVMPICYACLLILFLIDMEIINILNNSIHFLKQYGLWRTKRLSTLLYELCFRNTKHNACWQQALHWCLNINLFYPLRPVGFSQWVSDDMFACLQSIIYKTEQIFVHYIWDRSVTRQKNVNNKMISCKDISGEPGLMSKNVNCRLES